MNVLRQLGSKCFELEASSLDLFPITVFNKGKRYKTFYYSVVQSGLNEADSLKTSSILIYSRSEQSLYSQRDWQ
jgi:hypothetical protein